MVGWHIDKIIMKNNLALCALEEVRRCDHPEPDLGNQRFDIPSPSLECASACLAWSHRLPEGHGLETVMWCWDHLKGTLDRTQLRTLCKLWRLGRQVWRSTHLAATQDKPCMQIPLLMKPATHQSGVACLFPQSLCTLWV